MRSLRPDVVLTYTIKPNIYAGMAAAALKIPCLANVTGLGTAIENGGFSSKALLRLYRQGIKKAACVFFQNRANCSFFREKGIVRGKSRIIPGSGVNLTAHPFVPYPTESEPVRFLFIGRILKDKGIEELLSAFLQLHKEGCPIMLNLVGSMEDSYEELVRQAEETGCVRYLGQQSDVNPFIARAHCVILPSYHEGMSNVMLEAASSGRPVITTRVPGCMETFEEGVTGFGCAPKSTDSLKDAMRSFLRLSREEWAQMGRQGRKKVEKEFDRNIVIDAYLSEIRSAI